MRNKYIEISRYKNELFVLEILNDIDGKILFHLNLFTLNIYIKLPFLFKKYKNYKDQIKFGELDYGFAFGNFYNEKTIWYDSLGLFWNNKQKYIIMPWGLDIYRYTFWDKSGKCYNIFKKEEKLNMKLNKKYAKSDNKYKNFLSYYCSTLFFLNNQDNFDNAEISMKSKDGTISEGKVSYYVEEREWKGKLFFKNRKSINKILCIQAYPDVTFGYKKHTYWSFEMNLNETKEDALKRMQEEQIL